MKKRAYLESSVWNRIVDRTNPARRRITRRFLRTGRKKLRWYTSVAVTRELGDTRDFDVRRALLRQMKRHRPRPITTSADVFPILEDLISRGAGTRNRIADLQHVALAITGGMDYLVSWDERHLANERVRRIVRAYCRERSYTELRIGTPSEVIGWINKKSI